MPDPPKAHELHTAETLNRYSVDVDWRETLHREGEKNPDVLLFDEIWEFKAPKGSSEKSTIDSQFKRGKKQSEHLVIDLFRCGLEDSFAVGEVEKRLRLHERVKKVVVIDKDRRLHFFSDQ
nr:hypothetical protein [Schaalia sp. lx-100]